jgi:DNA polymerase III epsilon subunit-like protein
MDNALIYSEDSRTIISCDITFEGELIIPDGVDNIAEKAFWNCKRLTSIIIPNSVKNIGNWAFYNCSGLTYVDIPNSVTSIGLGAFNGCSGLKSVTIPNSVTSIKEDTFYGCSGLISIDIPNSVTNIDDCAFYECSSLISVNIPNSVISIGTGAFPGCSGLTSVDIPNSVISIGTGALADCIGLISVFLPYFIKSITEDVFFDCPNLKNIYIPKGSSAKFVALLPELKDKMVEQEQILTKDTKDRLLLFFFDTETTGLPRDWEAPSSDVTNWPRIVQISWIVSNVRGQIISRQNYIVKPEGFSIPPELAKVHGITTERALEEGEKLNNILDHFLRDIQQVSFIVGHNISFDKNVVAAEIYRKGNEKHLDENCIDKYVDMLETKPTICTMLSSTNFCRIPRYDNGYKWPKLSELYYKLFNKELVDAHDSSVDVQATFDCFWRLKELGIIGNIDIEDNVIQENEQCVHINKIRFTTFLFNSSIFSGYGGSTSDFSKRLITYEWKLYVSNEKPQDLMFCYPQTLHIMDNGRGINGTYSLKDNNSLLLSMDGESLYLHCVYYNEEIIIFQFDQSNEHLLLYQKHLVFSSDNDIRNYLNRVKQHVDTQRRNARKQREIELKERADSLIKDITRTDVEISDKRVSTLKTEMKQLASILGSEEAEKYQSYIDNAVKENQKEKEEKALAVENSKRAKKERKAKLLVKIINWTITIVFIAVWLLSTFLHFFSEWEICYSILKWSAIISGICIWILLNFRGAFERFSDAKVLTGIFALFTIVLFAIYDYEYRSFKHGSDKYLSRTVFHLFDGEAKRRIRNRINDSYDLCDLKMYLSDNKSGYYVEEAKGQLYYASDQLCRQAETLGDWKYIINNAPQEYKVDAEKNYARLDSFVWDNEELAYLNAKSLHTIEAYDKYLSRRFDNNKHCLEIDSLRVERKKVEDMMRRGDEALKRMIRSKHR